MNATVPPRKKLSAAKAPKAGTPRGGWRRNPTTDNPRTPTSVLPDWNGKARAGTSQRNVPAIQLPTQLERDTLLTPLWVAESIVQEVERFLKAELPANWARRLAAKAHYLYPRHQHFKAGLNRPGWRGMENLRMFMRHWTAGWLRRELPALFKQLPHAFANGQRLPAGQRALAPLIRQ